MELLDKIAPTAIAAYVPFYTDLAQLEQDNQKLTFDYESKKGNAEARSHVYKLRQSKGALERARKAEKADILVRGKAIDSEAQALEARIEAMIAVHQSAIDAIEQREKTRQAAHAAKVDAIRQYGGSASTADEMAQAIAALEVLAIGDDYEEYQTEALALKDTQLQGMRKIHAAFVKSEAEAAELVRLRAEALVREQKEREDAIARAAVERAQAEAAAKAEQERTAAARAMAEAEAKAKAEREAAERRELELRLQAENAERRRVEQEQAAERERTEAAARAERERVEAIARAERQAAEAVQREQERVAAAARAEAAEQAKREANKAHKAKINRAALAALVAGGMSEECAKQCVTLIASGKVPAVTINY